MSLPSALDQIVAGTAPEDYRKPESFFARTCFPRALRDHAGMVLRRLFGRTENTTPVLTLPQVRVAVFVGNAWDSQPGRETPWIDVAR